MDELRATIKSIYSQKNITQLTYEYTDLEHIEDIDKRLRTGFPTNVIARIEYCYSEYSIFWNIHNVVNHVWLASDGSYRMEAQDENLEKAVKKWLLNVTRKYYASLS